MLLLLILYFVFPNITVLFKIINILILFTLTIKTQFLLVYLINLYKKSSISLYLLINQLKKINMFIVKKKLNTGLFFNKIMLPHITTFNCIIIGLILMLNIRAYSTLISLQLIFILFNSLGIYWSIQENLWGGAWDWNLIEIGILVIITYNLILIHQKKIHLYTKHILILQLLIYLYYNHIPVILNIHSFTFNKLTKYNLILILLPLIIYLRTIWFNFTTIVILLIWIYQFFKLSNPNLLIKYTINTYLIYYTIYTKSINIVISGNLIFLIVQFINTVLIKQKSNFLNMLHKLLFSLYLIIILYQCTYSVNAMVLKYNLLLNNIKLNSFVTSKNNYFKKSYLKKLNSISILYKNNFLITTKNIY